VELVELVELVEELCLQHNKLQHNEESNLDLEEFSLLSQQMIMKSVCTDKKLE